MSATLMMRVAYEKQSAEQLNASRLGVSQTPWNDVRGGRKGVENGLFHTGASEDRQ